MKTLLIALALCATNAVAADCANLYQSHLKTDLALPYKEFDQTMNSGFRMIAEACPKEAADLIEAYIHANKAKESSLVWHVAQFRATQGDYAAAIIGANAVLSEKEDFEKNPLRWNDYILATIAFLKHDKENLQIHRDRVAAAAAKEDFFGNKLNLIFLDSLVRNFDKDYRYASMHIDVE